MLDFVFLRMFGKCLSLHKCTQAVPTLQTFCRKTYKHPINGRKNDQCVRTNKKQEAVARPPLAYPPHRSGLHRQTASSLLIAHRASCSKRYLTSKRSKSITFVHAVTKSFTNFSLASLLAYTSANARNSEFEPKIKSVRVAVHLS